MILICDYKLLTFSLMLLTTVLVVCETKILTFIAHERGKVELRCPYESGYEENEKYLCRGKCPVRNKVIPVKSGSPAEDQRFSLTDNTTARVFTITITDLRTGDRGQYWCGIMTGILGFDDYTEIELKINLVPRVSAVSGQNVSITCSYEDGLKDGFKFICKGSDPSLCAKSATKVSSDMRNNGRFSLKDDQSKRVFTVSIRDLTEEDSGIYWCGAVERRTHENKWISVKELIISNVSPEEASPTDTTTPSFHSSKPTETTSDRAVTSSSSSSSTSSSSSQTSLLLLGITSANNVFAEKGSDASVFQGFTVVIMLVVIGTLTGFGFALFLYFRRRQKKEGLQPKNVDHQQTNHPPNGDLQTSREDSRADYEEISNALDHPDNISVLPEFGDPDISVYALAQLPRSPSDSLHYSSIRFSATHCSDRTKTQDTSDYATVIH